MAFKLVRLNGLPSLKEKQLLEKAICVVIKKKFVVVHE